MVEEHKIPVWQKLGALALAAIVVICIIVFWQRFVADFWPPDRSFVGPNLVASVVQWVIIFCISILVYPPWRRRFSRFLDSKFSKVHGRLDKLEKRHDEHADHLDEIHESLKALHKKFDDQVS